MVSIFSTAAEAYRDTTKWLVAFVPIAALVSAAAVLGPHVARTGSAGSPVEWMRHNTWALVGVAAVIGGVLSVVSGGARVLSAQPDRFTELLTIDGARLSEAFSSGVGAPYFLDDRTFKDALAGLDASWAAGMPVSDHDLARAVAATDLLRDWSMHRRIAESFSHFRWAFSAGVLLIVAGITLMLATVAGEGPIHEPIEVQVELDSAGADDLVSTTGCMDPLATTFTAVSGTWRAPVLAVDGPGCNFGAEWWPRPDTIELRLHDADVP